MNQRVYVPGRLAPVALVSLFCFALSAHPAAGSLTHSQETGVGDGGPALKASINGPTSVAVDADGNVYIAESVGNRIRRLDACTRVMTTLAGDGTSKSSGDGGPAADSRINYPTSLALDRDGNVYVAEIGNRVRKIESKTRVINTVAGNGGIGITGKGDGGPAVDATFRGQLTLAVDPKGNLFIADSLDHRVRRVDAGSGVITTVAGTGEQGFSGDGDKAEAARLQFPSGIAVDAQGDLYIADYENCRIRKVDARTGRISTIAGTGVIGSTGDGGTATEASLNYPGELTIDGKGDVYFVEGGADRVRRIDAQTGIISTFAGSGKKGFGGDEGLATQAKLNNPSGLAVDAQGNIYITEYVNNRVRRVDSKTERIKTVAGNGLPRRVELLL